jgi:hypothetical protein
LRTGLHKIALIVVMIVTIGERGARADRIDDLSNTLENDPTDKARIAAAISLGRLADSRAVPSLMVALSHDKSAVVRGVAASALGHIGDPRAATVLEKALTDENEGVRTRARDALAIVRERVARDSGGAVQRDKVQPHEAPRVIDDSPDPPRMYIVVQTASNKTGAGGKALSGKMRDIMVATLSRSSDVTLDATTGKNLKQFAVDGSITELKRSESGKLTEIYCEVKITVSNERGRMVGIVTGTATLQLTSAAFKKSVEKDLQVQALENAVQGAHQNLMDYLGRQVDN